MEAPCPLLTPMVEFQLALLESTRNRMLACTESLNNEQLHRIPPSFHNNILWNLGHALVSQQILCYERSGLPPRIPVYFLPLFRKGTNPTQWKGSIDVAEVRSWLIESVPLLREDIRNNIFRDYAPYETSLGIVLPGFAEALAYAVAHETQHLGVIQTLRKLV
jgi:hypothetical protein